MGATILVHWPGATPEEAEGGTGFFNDDRAWANWLVNVLEDAAAVTTLERLGARALLCFTSDDVDADDVDWTTPDELEHAALRAPRARKQPADARPPPRTLRSHRGWLGRCNPSTNGVT